jgi:RHS repeat-associated protein
MFTIRSAQLEALAKSHNSAVLATALANHGRSVVTEETKGQVRATDDRGNTTRYQLDNHGRLDRVQTPTGRAFEYSYTPLNQLKALRSSQGLSVDFEYHEQGGLGAVKLPSGESWQFEWNLARDLQRFTYPDGSSVKLEYAGPGQVIAVTDRAGYAVHFDRNTSGQITSFRDANNHRTMYSYGQWDRPDRINRPDGSTEEVTRDVRGRLIGSAINGAPWANMDYDGDGRLTAVRYADGHFVEFEYDDAGRVVQAKNPAGVVRRSYDQAGRLLAEDQLGKTVRYEYDQAGKLVSLISPDNDTLAFGYDADERLSEVVDWAGGRHTRAYDASGGGFTHRHPNGATTRVASAAVGPPTAVRVYLGGGRREFSLKFTYTPNLQLATVKDSELGTRHYTYDLAGRVAECRGQSARLTESFSYDASGNRVRAGDSAEFDALNQISRTGGSRMAYDERGNLIALSDERGATRYHFNGQNLLTRVELFDGRRIEYTYDAFARRIAKRCGDEVTRYIWAGDQLLSERVDQAGKIEQRDYLFEPDTFTPLAQRVDGVVYQCHPDHRGMPRLLTDPTGNIAWSGAMSVFGSAVEMVRKVRQPYRLPGQYHDEETGLYYNRARYYNPRLGRYHSRDPLDLIGGWNWYAYAENDPVNGNDPLGLVDWGKVGMAALATVGGAVVVAVGATVVAAAVAATAPVWIGIAAGAAVIAGAAFIGGGISMLFASDGCKECQWAAFKKGALMGAVLGAAALLMMLTPAGPALAAVGGVAIGTGAVSVSAVTAAVVGVAAAAGVVAGASSTGGGAGDGEGEGEGKGEGEGEGEGTAKQDKRLSKGEIKKLQKNDIDPHDLKPKYEGSKYDLFKDKDGNISVKPKDGSGPGEPTGININHLD